MTILEFEDALSDEEELAQQPGRTVKCGWCGEIIHLDGSELALAMCQTCFQRVLEEFVQTQQKTHATSHPSHASDR